MIKALFFDVDGTLVSFKTHKIPERTIQALQMAHDQGVKIFTATGRPKQLLNNIPEVEHLMDGYILATGALCIYGEGGPDLARGGAGLGGPLPQAQHFFCRGGQKDIQFLNRNEMVDHAFFDMLKVTYNKYDVPLEEVIDQGVLQITSFITEEQEKEIMPQLPGCASARWYPTFCDITSATADKARGIRAMADYLGFDISETMAFGDGGNDRPMLCAAGIGVAMGNAVDEVKAHADYVTSTVDEDGVWNALRHFDII